MTVQINYKSSNSKKISSNLVLFVDEKFNISGLKKHISNSELSYISDLLKNSDLKKDLLVFEINSKKTIFLVSIKKDIKTSDIENLGAKFHGYINYDKKNDYFVNSDTINTKIKNFLGYFLHGIKLKSYEFNIYKSKKNKKTVSINVIGNENKISLQDQLRFKALEEGTFFARDLVSEPGNILHPDEYAKRINSLKKFGLKINIYDDKKLKKLGMNALLGVGQGSIRGSYLVTMEWNGVKNNSKPLAFVGKGVCFDTGGYSLKPAKFMEDMTYDMAGSATVVGLMKNLAVRKAKINAVGVVGLVENMPGGNAQRPGDIVKSYSGKTIEVLNTDAEGRLILADALTYAQRYKPKSIIDMATLTGACVVALGQHHSGLMSNSDHLAEKLLNAGIDSGDATWRLPLTEDYSNQIVSNFADVANISTRGSGAGTITAGCFLQKFVGDFEWAHIDIAGVAWLEGQNKGATGRPVGLVSEFLINESGN